MNVSASKYSVAVYGVPTSYFGDAPSSTEPMTDEEWADKHGLTLPEDEESDMPMDNSRLIPLTDHRGMLLIPKEDNFEPYRSSIVMTEGLHGTAWQRHFADGLWHSTRGGRPKTWYELTKKRNLVLVYDAEERAS
jgi:hypothetical protein